METARCAVQTMGSLLSSSAIPSLCTASELDDEDDNEDDIDDEDDDDDEDYDEDNIDDNEDDDDNSQLLCHSISLHG